MTHHMIRRAAAVALALAAAALPVSADDDDDVAPTGACTATANLLQGACRHERADDLFVAKAKCLNIANTGDRRTCLAAASEEYEDSARTCAAQLAARRAACLRLGEARYDPPFDPALFDADFRQLSNPNPYFPLGIGNTWELRGGDERNLIEILDATKRIEGVNCIVYRDRVYEDGKLKEATDDWFAAARDGTVWYCGEESKDYEFFDGDRPKRAELVSIDGSFKHGRDHDKAGIIMPGQPRVGQYYREEFSLGNAEDVSEIVATNYGWGENRTLDRHVPRELAQRLCQRDCVVTRNGTPIEPGSVALKYYARGIGFFLEVKPDEGVALQLVGCNFDQRCIALPQP